MSPPPSRNLCHCKKNHCKNHDHTPLVTQPSTPPYDPQYFKLFTLRERERERENTHFAKLKLVNF